MLISFIRNYFGDFETSLNSLSDCKIYIGQFNIPGYFWRDIALQGEMEGLYIKKILLHIWILHYQR